MIELARKIIEGRRLTRDDDLEMFISCDLDELCRGADMIRRSFSGDHVDLCTIINGKAGRCSENCAFCAQSAHNRSHCEEYGFLPTGDIVSAAKENEAEGVDRFAIVTADRRLHGGDFEKALGAISSLHRETGLKLCASMGLLTGEQLHRLHLAGITSIHENIETSRRNFPNICTTHTYDDKVRIIKAAANEGLRVCSGGIIGMGETWADRLDMAVSLAELGVDSIPLNALMPIPGTPLAHLPQLSEEEILRTVAFFRYIDPQADIRMAAGRGLLENSGRRAFESGASAAITGNMLTTTGSTIKSDRTMLSSLGRLLKDSGQATA
ncbi:MAG: biotin synthase BioB [Anaerovoracaceae bacterium]|jgi:biotin synthase